MNKTFFNPIDYLTPKNISPNVSPIGIILPFQITKPFKISILLFYDYRTGRVERYLVNSEKNIANTLWSTDEISDVFYFKGKKHMIDNRKIHEKTCLQDIYNPMLNDGLMSPDFYKAFIQELMRDYMATLLLTERGHSFNYTNMDVIRRLTHPNFSNAIGSGWVAVNEEESLHASKHVRVERIAEKDNPLFLKTDFSKVLLLHEPRKFKDIFLKWLNSGNRVMCEPLEIKNNSQGLLDLKRTLDIKSIKSLSELDCRIRSFNYHIVLKLSRNQYLFDRNENGY